VNEKYYRFRLEVLEKAFYVFANELEKVNTPLRNQVKYFKKLFADYKNSSTPEERQRRLDKLCVELMRLKSRLRNDDKLSVGDYERNALVRNVESSFSYSYSVDVDEIVGAALRYNRGNNNLCYMLDGLVKSYEFNLKQMKHEEKEDETSKTSKSVKNNLTNSGHGTSRNKHRSSRVVNNSNNSNKNKNSKTRRTSDFAIPFVNTNDRDNLLPIEKLIKRKIAQESMSISDNELEPYNLNYEEKEIIDKIVFLCVELRYGKKDRPKDLIEYFCHNLQDLLYYYCKFSAKMVDNSNKDAMSRVFFHFNPLKILRKCENKYGRIFSETAVKAANDKLGLDVLDIVERDISKEPRFEIARLTHLMTPRDIMLLYYSAKTKKTNEAKLRNYSVEEQKNSSEILQIEFADAIRSNPNYHSPFKKSANEEVLKVELLLICIKYLKDVPVIIVGMGDKEINDIYKIIYENVADKKMARNLIAYIEVARSGKVEEIANIDDNTNGKKR